MVEFWQGIIGKEREAMQKVAETDVKAIEGTAPGACRADARALYGRLKSGEIFGAFGDQDRETIWGELCRRTRDRLVPSFSTFFEDLNWLKEPVNCVKRLVHLSPRETILSALEDSLFSGVNQIPGQCMIQQPDCTFVPKPATRADQVDLGIRQIFLIAIRKYLEMPAEPKRKNLLAKIRPKKADTGVLYNFASDVYRLGFESSEIHRLMGLRTPSQVPQEQPATSDSELPDVPIKRYGIPWGHHHEQNKPRLFLENLHSAGEELEQMTSFFVRRSVILAFFGKPTSACLSEASTHPHPLDPGADGTVIVREHQERPPQSDQQSLEQHQIRQHPESCGIQNPLQPSPHADNPSGQAKTSAGHQREQHIITGEEQVELDWESDQDMIDEVKPLPDEAGPLIRRNRRT